jgi:ABC-type Fe3+ transport system permease subunit
MSGTRSSLMLAACIVVTVWLVFVPVAALLYNAFTEDTGFGPGALSLENFVEAYSSWHILRLLRNSLMFAIASAVITFIMGASVAWVVERTDAPGTSLFHSLALLSFAIPGLLIAMAWIFIFSPNIGWGNALLKSVFGLGEAPVNIYSMLGMAWALSSHYFPLAYLSLGPAMRVLDTRMEEAGLMSGGNYAQVLGRVTLPLLRPAILSALLLLFVIGMASYEVPRLIGRPARIDVFTTEIQGAIVSAPPAFGVASALGLALLLICVLAVYFYRRATANADSFATITGKGYRPTRIKLGCWRWPVALGIGTVFALALGLPLLTLVWQSFFRNLAQPFVSSAANVTLDNYRFILSYPIFLAAVKTSVLLAAMAATAVGGLTFVMAWIAQRSRLRSRRACLCADCHPGRDRRRRHPGGLSPAADCDLQHDLDPPDRLCDSVPSLRHALCVERDRPDPSRARGDGRRLGRRAGADFWAHHAAAARSGSARRLDLRFRSGGARARRLDLSRRPRHACARHHQPHHVGGGRQLRRGRCARRPSDHTAAHDCDGAARHRDSHPAAEPDVGWTKSLGGGYREFVLRRAFSTAKFRKTNGMGTNCSSRGKLARPTALLAIGAGRGRLSEAARLAACSAKLACHP